MRIAQLSNAINWNKKEDFVEIQLISNCWEQKHVKNFSRVYFVCILVLWSGFPLDLENLEKWEYTWKTWKYHGILKNVINIMEK